MRIVLRREVKIGLALAGASLIGTALGFGPVVRAQARAQAERRGIELEIGAVRPGLGRIWLKELTVRLPEVPALEARLDSVEVGLSAGLGVRRVVARGGVVTVRGSPAELERQVREWRSRRAAKDAGAASPVAYVAEGLDLVWHDAAERSEPQHVWGARYERSDAGEKLAFDRAQIGFRGVSIELRNATLGLSRMDGRRVLERVVAEALTATVDLDALPLGVSKPSRAEKSGIRPVSTAAPRPGAPGAMALTERLNRWIPLDPERGPRLRAEIGRSAKLVAEALPDRGELDLSGVRLRVTRGAQGLGIGPARLRVTRSSDGLALQLVPGRDEPAETPLELALDVPLASGPVRLSVDGGPVSLAALGVQAGDLGLRDVERAKLEISGKALLSADGRALAWQGGGKIAHVSLEQRWLAPGRIDGLSLGIRGKGEVLLDGSRVDLHDADVDVGQVQVELHGLIERNAEWTRAHLRGGVPLESCQAMLDSAPRGFAPLLTGMKLAGTFSLAGRVEFDTQNLDRMVTEWTVANECRITATSAETATRRFQQTWVRQVKDAAGRTVALDAGPGAPGWTPRAAISRHMETAVLICEDGGFFRHEGFDQEAIRNSIRENVKAGKFVRGASTISMQLAKNLYLSRDKTLSRKLQEAALTMLLEQELSKEQILELYLNVIEFGPGIYGIGAAAQHYFSTTPAELSLGQSLYLASILPNPSRQYFGAGGQVTPGWMAYLRKLMKIAVKIRRITEEELEDAAREQVTFGVPYSPRLPVESETAASERAADEAQFGPVESFDGN